MAHLLLGAAHKSSGKTVISLGICRALRDRGLAVQPFKKGPDYIDPMWLSRATSKNCYNLDFNTMSHPEILSCFSQHSTNDLSLIEGNHGLYDSYDIEGNSSNAALARLLQAPVVLVVDVNGATRSLVPLILGFQQFEPRIKIAAIILSKVAGARHELRLRQVIDHYCHIPIVGAVWRNPKMNIDERHLGLIPSNESLEAEQLIDRIAKVITQQVDLDQLLTIARESTPPPRPDHPLPGVVERDTASGDITIGYTRDQAFGFYYPDDLEQLESAGARLVPIDALSDATLPPVDGLFLGGGFPESHMERLEANRPLREAFAQAITAGLPCYAECGGLIYLSRNLTWGERRAEMVGVIPGDAVMHPRPQGRGYVELHQCADHPWPAAGGAVTVPAHEFHYSTLENLPPGQRYAYQMKRGQGIDGKHDGIVIHNLLATYSHLRSVEGNRWAERFIDFVRAKKRSLPQQ